MRLIEAITNGDATAVFAYDMSRLHRNAGESDRFWKLVAEKEVKVYLTDMIVDPSPATGRMIIGMIAQMNAWLSEVTSEKIRATMAMKRADGDKLGGRLYGEVRTITSIVNGVEVTRTVGIGEDPLAVVEAYRSTRSFLRATKVLDAAKVPTRNGASRGWSPSAVKAIVGRLAPDLIVETRVEDRPIRGSRATAQVARFGRVLRCSVDGALLTPSYDGKSDTWRYYCHGSHRVGHGRKGVTESSIARAIMPAIESTTIRMRRAVKDDGAAVAIDTDALAAKRERFIEMYGEGLVTKERRDEVIAEVEADLIHAASMRRVRIYTLPPDPATDSPERVNSWMRDTFNRVVVDMATPGKRGVATDVAITPEWRDPSMHVEDEGDAA